MTIDEALDAGAPSIMAILRGIRPEEAVGIAQALVSAGIRLIEVPFNSPEPARSIAAMASALDGSAAIGGGTVLSLAMVDALAAAKGRFMVSPNTDPAVIAHARAAGLDVLPGFMTPSEAFTAYAAGARRLKLFPGSALSPNYISSLRDVLPKDAGIGVGGSLYRPGDTPEAVGEKAAKLVDAWARAS